MSRDIDRSSLLNISLLKKLKNSVNTKQLAAKSQPYLRCLKLSFKNLTLKIITSLQMGRRKTKNHNLNTHLQKIDSLSIAPQWGKIHTWKKDALNDLISNLSQKKLFILIYLVPLPV